MWCIITKSVHNRILWVYYIKDDKFTTENGGTSIRVRGGSPGGSLWRTWKPKRPSTTKTHVNYNSNRVAQKYHQSDCAAGCGVSTFELNREGSAAGSVSTYELTREGCAAGRVQWDSNQRSSTVFKTAGFTLKLFIFVHLFRANLLQKATLEATHTNFIVFDIRGPEIKPTIYHTLTITSPR
jgi:hypothetical protein